MARKVYEESNIAAIAEKIREKTGGEKTYTTAEMPSGVDAVYDAGKQAEYDAFWDAYQKKTKLSASAFAGRSWNDTTFKPKYDIVCPDGIPVDDLFFNSAITDLEAALNRKNVILDVSQASRLDGAFSYTYMTIIPEIVIGEKCTNIGNMCKSSNKLHTIRKLTFPNKSFTVSNAFVSCTELENIEIGGTIACNGLDFQWSTLLSRASIESIINHLSDTTTGYTLTLSKTAVENSFTTGTTILCDRAVGTEEINGLTITTGEDGSITFNGTATAETTLQFDFPVAAKEGEIWTASFGGSVWDIADFYAIPWDHDGSIYPNTMYDYLTMEMSEGDTVFLTCIISSGKVIDNVTLKPNISIIGSEWAEFTATKPNWTILLI